MKKLILIIILLQSYAFGNIDIKGHILAKQQIEKGLSKRIERRDRRDESLHGLKDVINDSNDPELKKLYYLIEELEQTIRESEASKEFKSDFIKRFYDICYKIDRQYGIPSCVVISQIIGESGWGGSNVTILKSNILGIGNRPKKDKGKTKYYTVFIGDQKKTFPVRFLKDTTAFYFESVSDCIFFYVNRIMIDDSTEVFYGDLRTYIDKHKNYRPDDYVENVVYLLSRKYHHNPNWYYAYLMQIIKENNLRKQKNVNFAKKRKYAIKKKFKIF